MAQPIRLGDLLVRAGVVSELDVQRALNEQKRWGGRLGTTLVRMGVLTEDLLVKALAKQLDLPRANLEAISLPPEVRGRIDRLFCERNTLVPLAVDQAQGRLLLAVADPLGSTGPDELGRALGLRPEIYLAGESSIQKAITKLFATGAPPRLEPSLHTAVDVERGIGPSAGVAVFDPAHHLGRRHRAPDRLA
jgi:type IV pilus assembly protein PilB